MASFQSVTRRAALATGLMLGGGLVLSGACRSDPNDLPHPDTSQGDEFGDPEAEQAADDPSKPIDPDKPEDRMTTVESPPELPTEPQAGAGGAP